MDAALAPDNAPDGAPAPPPAADGAGASPAAASVKSEGNDASTPPPAVKSELDSFDMDLEAVAGGEPLAAADAAAVKTEEDAAAVVKTEEGAAPGNDEASPQESASPEVDDDAAGVEDAAESETEGDAAEGGDEPEMWDLKMVLKAGQITGPNPDMCQTVLREPCGLNACSIWASNLAPEEPWYSCLDCQASDFQGWPDKKDPKFPLKVLSDELRQAMLDKCTRFRELREAELPDLPAVPGGVLPSMAQAARAAGVEAAAAASGEDAASSDGEGDWELKKIFDVKALGKARPKMCESELCDLQACSKWVAQHDTENPWFSCVDCQEKDYQGWPTDPEELPIKHLTEENRTMIVERCSKQDEPVMPDLPESLPLLVTAGKGAKGHGAPAITPPPSHSAAVAAGQSEVVVGMARSGKGGGKKAPKGGVTPSPMPPKGASKKAAKGESKKESKKAAKASKDDGAKKPAAMSKKTLETHAKWQAEAERLGGPSAKIVVSKADAKKLVFDALHDSFKPMNINGLFLKLKAVVPSVILRSCLDEMVDRDLSNPFADDSDDEDGGKKSKKGAKKSGGGGDGYAGSLLLKEGRSVNATLYYVDHSKLANNGNGLLPEKRNELVGELQGAKAELELLSAQSKETNGKAAKLESEPKNEELVLELAELEAKDEAMKAELETARGYAGNEKRAMLVKKEIQSKAGVWRKRKRQTLDFIQMMEESTEGAVTLKKCLKGDVAGLDLDDDESAIKGAIAFTSKPRVKRAKLSGLKGGKGASSVGGNGITADASFIGVKLSAQGLPQRVYMPDKENQA